MRITILMIILLLCYSLMNAQEDEVIEENESLFMMPEFLIGTTAKANKEFPENLVQKDYFLSFGKFNYSNTNEWATRLGYPKTGVILGYVDFGDDRQVGQGFVLLPFIEFDLGKRFHINTGMGMSYVNKTYDPITNPNNKGITNHLNWTFRFLTAYDVLKTKHIDWRLGVGYLHHSNGHTRIPNQGINSFLVSASALIDTKYEHRQIKKPTFKRTSQTYLSPRFGFGLSALSEEFNTIKPVYTFSFTVGKIINRTFKFGVGLYYRFYQHYYDYISNEEELIVTDYPFLTEKPIANASTYGLSGSFEFLLGHVGAEVSIGLNISKPFYAIDYQITEGHEYQNEQGETVEVLGELGREYDIKRVVAGRMGINYYLKSNNDMPKHNWYVGAHINSNLGRADFTEFSLGYVYRLSQN